MNSQTVRLETFKKLAMAASHAYDALLAFWQEVDEDVLDVSKDEADEVVDLLEQLVVKRIDVLNAFSQLVRIRSEAAVRVLLDRYLGHFVSPDMKFGGYESELSNLLDDLARFHGESALLRLLQDPSFDREKLRDRRVIRSMCDALSVDSIDQLKQWMMPVDPALGALIHR